MDDTDAPTDAAAAAPRQDESAAETDGAQTTAAGSSSGEVQRKRRRGSRGGQRRKKAPGSGEADATTGDDGNGAAGDDRPDLPEPMREGRASPEAAERALVRKPQIGDTRPAPATTSGTDAAAAAATAKSGRGRRRGDRKPGASGAKGGDGQAEGAKRKRAARGGRKRATTSAEVLPEDLIEQRRGRERKGRPAGRYLMCVQVRENMAQVAVLEGRNLIEHYVSRPADDISQIHGNIYVGRVQNVLPGMEAAFVDIATPKNAVLYRGDVQYDAEDIEEKGDKGNPRIEDILRARQLIVCQVTKNPIGAKGARLTQEVSLPGRFVVLIPNSKTYGISKRLPDDVRKRLRGILDRVKPAEHGLIVRTA
ncbi:MAG: ribonuclease E/G, partial [Desertimonas sp.]